MNLTHVDDTAFLAAVARCEVPAADFDHQQHLRLAWLHLRQAPLPDAIERCCADLARFAAHHGADGKFHRTVTEALLRVMAAQGATETALGWPDFLQRNPALRTDARGLLARHYSPTLLASSEARLTFLPPDRLPLPA